MKRKNVLCLIVGVLVLAMLVVLPGCSGVWMNAKYSDMFDRAAAVSAEIAKRAEAGEILPADMVGALKRQALTWEKFQNARDGVKGGDQQ